MGGRPAADLHVDAPLVRRLLEEQHPDLADLPLRPLAEGWDNVLFRLGDEMTVRLPRRLASAALLVREQRWLPEVAVGLPLPVPVPIRVGRPSQPVGYPWAWTVAPWFPGGAAEHHRPSDLSATARRLGEFLAAIHRPAPADAPTNPWRGTPLAARTERLQVALDELGDVLDSEAVLTRWESLLVTPPWSAPPVWLHGDVHPLNLLVDQGELSAVIDFGDICAGDPASDLAVAWMMFPPAQRDVFRAAAQADDDTWRRAQGWALSLGVVFTNGDERITAIGQRTVAAVLADDGSPSAASRGIAR